MNKISSYIGFARKANKLLVGQTHLKHEKQEVYLIIVCSTASDNLKNLAKNLANKFNCPYILSGVLLSELTNIPDVKIVGLTDQSLSNAIIQNKEMLSIGKRN